MDLVLGSSKHTIDVLRNSVFTKQDKNTKQAVGKIIWERDGEVLFEGADTDVYQPKKYKKDEEFDLSNIKEDFAYLFLGHWMQGALGEDRKNVGLLVKSFYETFKNKKKTPALILKTSMVGASYMDRDEILKKIKAVKDSVKATSLPTIYLLHGDFSNEEVNKLYNHPKVKAMVCLTKGEGFGRPLLEFSLSNKPIITTNYSGHTDFLHSEYTTLLPGGMTNVHDTAANNMLLKESQWFSVDIGQVGHYMKDMFVNYKPYLEKAKRQGYHSRTNFSFDNMKEKLDEILGAKIPEFPKQVPLQLPKIGLPKLKKLGGEKKKAPTLPKLQKLDK